MVEHSITATVLSALVVIGATRTIYVAWRYERRARQHHQRQVAAINRRHEDFLWTIFREQEAELAWRMRRERLEQQAYLDAVEAQKARQLQKAGR
jgi:hypothetical protein